MTQNILITAAGGFMGKYLLDELRRNSPVPAPALHTAGIAPFNDYLADLRKETFQPRCSYGTVYHLLGACVDGDRQMLNVAATRNLLDSLAANPPQNMVYLSSTEVYGADEGIEINENREPEPVSETGVAKLETERLLTEWCKAHNVHLAILRCPDIVGTGMRGAMRQLVNSIYRGNYHHIEDETARLSVVHAVDVARAMRLLAGSDIICNITDGVNPSRRELAEAFAVRLNNKRIYTLRPKRARRLARLCSLLPFLGYNSRTLAQRYRTLTFADDRLRRAIGWQPHSVTDYLKTHDYDENSL